MKYKSWLLFVCILLITACGVREENQSSTTVTNYTRPVVKKTQVFTATSTFVQAPSATILTTKTPTEIPAKTTTPKPSLTSTTTPDPAEIILISYYISGSDGWPDWPDDCLLWVWRDQLTIYADGYVIVKTESGLFESYIQETEIKELIQEIEGTGFFQVPDEIDSWGRNLVYTTPVPEVGEGSSSRSLHVIDKIISIYDPLDDYLISSVRAAEKILQDYRPSGMVPYIPHELRIEAIEITGNDYSNLDYPFYVKPNPQVIPWSEELWKLENLAALHRSAVFKGEDIKPYLEMFPTVPMVRLFSEGNKVYNVVACPVVVLATFLIHRFS